MDYNTPLGRRQFAMKTQPKVLSVPNTAKVNSTTYADDAPLVDYRNMKQDDLAKLRQQTIQQQNKITLGNKDVIELLLGLKRKTSTIEIEGILFTVKSLKNKEVKFILEETAKATAANTGAFNSQALVMMDIKIRTLAVALIEIDNKPLELVLGFSGHDEIVDFLNELDDSVVNKIYDAYADLNKEVKKLEPKDAEEVTEELKK